MNTASKSRPILFSRPMVQAIIDGTKTQTRRIVTAPVDFIGGGGSVGPEWNDPDCWGWEDPDYPCHFLVLGRNPKEKSDTPIRCPFGEPGDELWVRETWQVTNRDEYVQYPGGVAETTWPSTEGRPHKQSQWNSVHNVIYKASGGDHVSSSGVKEFWRPSIHMPRWASRITLEVTGVRIERLNEITGVDAAAEGCEPDWDAFEDATVGMDGWDEPEEFIEECEEHCDWVNYGRGLVHSSEHQEWQRDRNSYALRLAFRRLWESINGPGSWDANPWVWVVEFKRKQ